MILKNKEVNSQWSIVNSFCQPHPGFGPMDMKVNVEWATGNRQREIALTDRERYYESKAKNYGLSSMDFWQWAIVKSSKLIMLFITCNLLLSCAGCKYSFKDVSIPVEVKTFRVNFLENKARYINPNLSPQLTEKLKEKIRGNTRLTQTNDDNAHYDINGYVSDYSVTTSGISGNTPSTNRLSVSFHLVFKNTLDEKKNIETDVTSTFEFGSTQTLSQVEVERNDEIVKNIVDAIFNKIFSNW